MGGRAGAALLACLAAGLALTGAAAATPAGVIAEYSDGLPTPSAPTGIAAGPDGSVWFTDQGAPWNPSGPKAIRRVGPTGVITPVLAESITPHGIATGPDGNLWYTAESTPVAVGRVTPAGVRVGGFIQPNTGGEMRGVAAGPDGNMWFAVGKYAAVSPGEIMRITPGGEVTEFPTVGLGGWVTPLDIAAGPDGNLWFTVLADPNEGRPGSAVPAPPAIGRITPDGAFTLFSAGLDPVGYVRGIAAGPDGNLWFTHSRAIGRITPAGVITLFTEGLNPESSPEDIAAGPDGNLWFTDRGTTPAVGRITPSGVITEFSAGLNPRSAPWYITAGPDGNLWFTDRGVTPAIGSVGSGAPPANVSGPVVAGTRRVGSRLSCRGDRWASWAGAQPRRDLFAFDGYRWRRDGVLLPGPSSPTYTPTSRDGGHRISCEVTVTYGALGVTTSAASAPVVVKPALLAVTIAGGTTVTRGARAAFTYRVRNATRRAVRGVVITNVLPSGLGVDRTSRTANLKAAVPLRFTGAGRRVTFRPGTIPAGTSLVVRVNAKVSARATRGATTNTVVVRGVNVPAATTTSTVTIR